MCGSPSVERAVRTAMHEAQHSYGRNGNWDMKLYPSIFRVEDRDRSG